MIRTLKEILDTLTGDRTGGEPMDREEAVRLATAVLVVELVRSDEKERLVESAVAVELLQQRFGLGEEEAQGLCELAEKELEDSVSLHRFTRSLMDDLSEGERVHLIEMLWRVALADDRLDPHEDYFVRKVADLLYVPHRELIRMRERVRDDRG
jgi:uncharacterized tellurite resistance protein B-like protein